MDRDELIAAAKSRALGMAKSDYRPPRARQPKVAGRSGYATLYGALWVCRMRVRSEYDLRVGQGLARVLSGGEVAAGTVVAESRASWSSSKKSFSSPCGERADHVDPDHSVHADEQQTPEDFDMNLLKVAIIEGARTSCWLEPRRAMSSANATRRPSVLTAGGEALQTRGGRSEPGGRLCPRVRNARRPRRVSMWRRHVGFLAGCLTHGSSLHGQPFVRLRLCRLLPVLQRGLRLERCKQHSLAVESMRRRLYRWVGFIHNCIHASHSTILEAYIGMGNTAENVAQRFEIDRAFCFGRFRSAKSGKGACCQRFWTSRR